MFAQHAGGAVLGPDGNRHEVAAGADFAGYLENVFRAELDADIAPFAQGVVYVNLVRHYEFLSTAVCFLTIYFLLPDSR